MSIIHLDLMSKRTNEYEKINLKIKGEHCCSPSFYSYKAFP